jgi:sigma-B regulation protein RsbU (phosphoserine phosphatase)
MPLGLMPEQDYAEQEVTLAAGDCILFYTDGLVEAHDGERQMFGAPRLKRLIQNHSRDDGLIESLLNDLQGFTGPEWEQEDDVTLVVLKKTG